MEAEMSFRQDHELWAAFQQGEETACTHLFHIYYNDLYNYGLKIAGDEAFVQDSIQELFITLWRTRDRLGQVKALKPYLMKSLRRSLLRAMTQRRNNRLKMLSVPMPDIVFSPEEVAIRHETSGARKDFLLLQLNNLSRRQREVIYLRYYDELSYDEIAQVMGLHYQSVMNHLHRALKALRSNHSLRRIAEVALALWLSLQIA